MRQRLILTAAVLVLLGVRPPTAPMPSYADLLTDEELGDVLAYLVTLQGL